MTKENVKPLEIFPAGGIEVGFSPMGPFLSLAGIIRSLNQDILVHSMDLTVVADRDKSTYSMVWQAFKPHFLFQTAKEMVQDQKREMSHPFLVQAHNPYRFNIVFHDLHAEKEVKEILRDYEHQWHKVVRTVMERRDHRASGEVGENHLDLVTDFKKQDICINSYTELNRKCYWEQGSYSLTLKINTEDALADQVCFFKFQLEKHDASLLKTNCVSMLDEPIAELLGKTRPLFKTVLANYIPG